MNNRQNQMKAYIEKNFSVRVSDLEQLFPEVSSMTIRRDLAALEEDGYIVRTRGGARMNGQRVGLSENMFSSREHMNLEAKQKISEKALAFLEEKRSIYLDAGTTVMMLARQIPDENLMLFTSAPNIALEIINNKQRPQVTLLGGNLSRTTVSTSGRAALLNLKAINIEVAFIATSGYACDSGFTVGDPYEAELKTEVIRRARRVIMLMDTDKVDRRLPYTFAQMEDIDVLISEKKLDEEILHQAAEHGVTVLP